MATTHTVSVADEIATPRKLRPHLVILGAGASRAALPSGDANGQLLPLMVDLVEILGLERELDQAGIPCRDLNFEEIYSRIAAETELLPLRRTVEGTVESYFRSLQLPPFPTVYDELLLSLRRKDVVATFNWDPFLVQAARRVAHVTKSLPYLLFLHGNVAHGFCAEDRVSGLRGARCSRCGEPFTPDTLLFPVGQKNYSLDPSISASWSVLRQTLQDALFVTIFGYSAPSSDRDAMDIMAAAWGGWKDRQFEQFEIIDILPEDQVRQAWGRFIHTHHYECHSSWRQSFLASHPRRSVEAFINQFIEAKLIEDNPIPNVSTIDDLVSWYRPLIKAEEKAGA